jgi:uncharacterized protein (DUF58 family)
MDEEALRERIRRLAFTSSALSRAFARGDFRSVFRGRGIEFDSLREYYPDDDARSIDWCATARSGRPYVRTYREDRSLTVFLVVDVSASMDQGSREVSKLDMAVMASSLVSYAAQFRGLPVGCLLFAESVLGSLPPRRGKAHALAVASSASVYASRARVRRSEGSSRVEGRGGRARVEGRRASDLGLALDTVSRTLKRRSLVLVISDFRAADWERPLAELGMRHDIVACRVTDASDLEAPASGSFFAADPESGETAWLSLGSKAFRARWRESGLSRRRRCLEAIAASRSSLLELDTSDDPALKLLEFFERRGTR